MRRRKPALVPLRRQRISQTGIEPVPPHEALTPHDSWHYPEIEPISRNFVQMSPSSGSQQLPRQSRNSLNFMESEFSLIWSQEPATRPYTEPEKSSSRPHMLVYFSNIYFNVILPSAFTVESFPQMFPPKILCAILSHEYYVSCPHHPRSLDNCNNTWRGIVILNFFIIN
jgi:hypothetical protein